MASSYVWDLPHFPRATASLEGRVYTVVLEGVDGLEAQRTPNRSERLRGILSLDPPTARSRYVDELVDLAIEAFDEAVRSQLGDTGTPGEYLMVRWKAAAAARGALEGLGVDA